MKFKGRPEFSKYSDRFYYGERYIAWYLDVAPKTHQILSLHFESDLDDDQQLVMDDLCHWAPGRKVGDMPTKFSTLMWPMGLISYRLFLRSISGGDIAFHKQKNESEDDLVCRCFGVYGQEVIEHLVKESESEHTLSSLGTQIKAGLGCGSCHKDLRGLLKTFGHGEKERPKEIVTSAWEKMESQELASACHAIAQAMLAKDKSINKLIVFGVKPGNILFQYLGEKESDDILAELRSVIRDELGPGLEVTLR
jgi:bacterioferritin-associated ferredoxin